MATFPVQKDQCFIFNADTPIEAPFGKLVLAKGDTFKCDRLFEDSEYPAVYGVRYSKSGQKFGKTQYLFPNTEFNNMEPVACPEVTGGRRRNRKITKKIRRNHHYSRRK